jgi:hypothetical protein
LNKEIKTLIAKCYLCQFKKKWFSPQPEQIRAW